MSNEINTLYKDYSVLLNEEKELERYLIINTDKYHNTRSSRKKVETKILSLIGNSNKIFKLPNGKYLFHDLHKFIELECINE